MAKSSLAVKIRAQITCKSCNQAPFKGIAILRRHIVSAHTGPFICVFDFDGCKSTFAGTNEWERHVSSQHLNLGVWICTLRNSKNDAKNNATGGDVEFNRKDLFTQHLRCMNAPSNVQGTKTLTPEWKERIKNLQSSCYVVNDRRR
jgi:hypothetical protein